MDVAGGLRSAAGRVHTTARRQPHADVAAAAIVYAVTLATTAAGSRGGGLGVFTVAVGAVACAGLVIRRRFPYGAFVTSAVAAEAYLVSAQGRNGSLVLAAPLIALYTLAEAGSRRRALTIGVLAVLALAGLHMLIKPSSLLGVDNLALAALGGLAIAAGDASRSRRAYLAQAQDRARQAEADREAEAARRVTEERLRIARDLHDAIGHHLALITVQAGVATHVLDSEPALSREALAHIRHAGREALGELRDTVGLLRQPGELAAPTEPLAGLAGLGQLLGSFRRSGLVVSEQVIGRARPIPVAADLTAYRVIQESLTNVCRHAGPTAVAVRLTYGADSLTVVIDDRGGAQAQAGGPPDPAGHGPDEHGPDGHGPGEHGPGGHGPGGHGLTGMGERVTAIGGELHAGPRPDGGYRVTATLPLIGRGPA